MNKLCILGCTFCRGYYLAWWYFVCV